MGEGINVTDGSLLTNFVRNGDEAAFETIVQRHAAMVLRVCRCVLSDSHEAQDVAQAVFLVLAKKAARLAADETAVGWLHRVAHDLAVDTLRRRQRRLHREEEGVLAMALTSAGTESLPEEAIQLLHKQIRNLPPRYREPIALHYLEGRSAEEAAGTLGLAPATLRKRLERGRARLRSRLTRLGWPVSVSALSVLLSAEAEAAVLPEMFVSATMKAAGLAAAGKLVAGVEAGMVSAEVAALTRGGEVMIMVTKLKVAAVCVLTSTLTVGSIVVVAQEAGKPAATESRWSTTTPGGPVDINPSWGTFVGLDEGGGVVYEVQSDAGQGDNSMPGSVVQIRRRIADGREESVRHAIATMAKGAKIKVLYVRDAKTQEIFVWDIVQM